MRARVAYGCTHVVPHRRQKSARAGAARSRRSVHTPPRAGAMCGTYSPARDAGKRTRSGACTTTEASQPTVGAAPELGGTLVQRRLASDTTASRRRRRRRRPRVRVSCQQTTCRRPTTAAVLPGRSARATAPRARHVGRLGQSPSLADISAARDARRARAAHVRTTEPHNEPRASCNQRSP